MPIPSPSASLAPPPPPASSAAGAAPASPAPNHIKETLISIIIAFVLAFVFRQFVIEAFIIPTGSMAPTLMGAHVRVRSANTGYEWPLDAQYKIPQPGGNAVPKPIQRGDGGEPVVIHDPMTGAAGAGQELQRHNLATRSGDRILVFKYLYSIYDPKRFDVVVFKAPHDPKTNYIKRLVGLPGEELAIVDGDVFTRSESPAVAPGQDSWSQPGWRIARKPERAQRSVWQSVFSSEFQPLDPSVRGQNGQPFKSPWLGGDGWKIDGQRAYEYTNRGTTTLSWNTRTWPIDDFYPYNEAAPTRGGINAQRIFPVSDLMLSCGVEPLEGSINVGAVVRTRGHDFRVDIQDRAVTLRMGPVGPDQPDGRRAPATNWTTLGSGTMAKPFEKGKVTRLEVWHVDQTLQVWVEGECIAKGEYNWGPAERVKFATGVSAAELVKIHQNSRDNPLGRPMSYQHAELHWEFGGPVRVHRVGVKRDVHYQPGSDKGTLARATHPTTTMHLGPDHFFVCGDNSPSSLDARLWGPPDLWVAKEIDATPGVVPRKLMIGKAFFVYFPSMIRGESSGLPVPDFGRLRWIF